MMLTSKKMIEIKNSFISKIKNEKQDKLQNFFELGAIIGNKKINYSGVKNWIKSRPLIENKACIKCGICAVNCPEDAIKIEGEKGNEKIIVNYNYCKGCGICAENCPQKAIKMK